MIDFLRHLAYIPFAIFGAVELWLAIKEFEKGDIFFGCLWTISVVASMVYMCKYIFKA